MVFLSLKKVIGSKKDLIVCGMDEAGCGPWAGPVVACAMIFDKDIRIKGLKNSKQLSEEKREEIYKKLKKKTYFGVGIAQHNEIDDLGLSKATNLAYIRALEKLLMQKECKKPDILAIDGREIFKFPIPQKSLIKGDEKVKIIACASIIAKVERDRIMKKMAKKYPKYGFELHKGYGTQRHQKAIKKHGVCEIHRKSFKPIIEATNSQ